MTKYAAISSNGQEPGNSPALNHDQLDAIRNLDPSNSGKLADKILNIFLDTVADIILQIDDAIKSEDTKNLSQAAHKLKSCSANIGAENLSSIANQLEQYGRTHALSQAKQLQPNLQQQYHQVVSEIKKILEQS